MYSVWLAVGCGCGSASPSSPVHFQIIEEVNVSLHRARRNPSRPSNLQICNLTEAWRPAATCICAFVVRTLCCRSKINSGDHIFPITKTMSTLDGRVSLYAKTVRWLQNIGRTLKGEKYLAPRMGMGHQIDVGSAQINSWWPQEHLPQQTAICEERERERERNQSYEIRLPV